MAYSYSYFKEDIAKYLKDKYTENARVLDVGAGSGTYYNYLGDYFKEMDAVEVFEPNIKEFDLENKYHKVFNIDIKDFKYDYYDIIIFGDILEHLNVKDAQKVLEYALNMCEEIIVAVPYLYEQGECYNNIYETHLQPDLTPEIMEERYPYLKLLYGNDRYGYYIKKES